MPRKIIIAGEGGQGIQLISKVLAHAAKKSGKNVTYLPSFGVEQRGGVSVSYVQISGNEIYYPRFSKADVVIVFCNRAISAIKDFINDQTLFIYDSSSIEDKYLNKIKENIKNYLRVPAKQIATGKFSSKVTNVILLGSMLAHLKDINYNEVEKAILNELKDKIKKDPKIEELNLGALNAGLDYAENFDMTKNPLSGSSKKELKNIYEGKNIKWQRYPEYCKGCGLCVVRCPAKALQFTHDLGFLGNPLPVVDMEKCIGCGKCMAICPDGAIDVNKNK